MNVLRLLSLKYVFLILVRFKKIEISVKVVMVTWHKLTKWLKLIILMSFPPFWYYLQNCFLLMFSLSKTRYEMSLSRSHSSVGAVRALFMHLWNSEEIQVSLTPLQDREIDTASHLLLHLLKGHLKPFPSWKKNRKKMQKDFHGCVLGGATLAFLDLDSMPTLK